MTFKETADVFNEVRKAFQWISDNRKKVEKFYDDCVTIYKREYDIITILSCEAPEMDNWLDVNDTRHWQRIMNIYNDVRKGKSSSK